MRRRDIASAVGIWFFAAFGLGLINLWVSWLLSRVTQNEAFTDAIAEGSLFVFTFVIVVTAYLHHFDDVAAGYEPWLARLVRAFAFANFVPALVLYTIALTIRYEGAANSSSVDLAGVGWILAFSAVAFGVACETLAAWRE